MDAALGDPLRFTEWTRRGQPTVPVVFRNGEARVRRPFGPPGECGGPPRVARRPGPSGEAARLREDAMAKYEISMDDPRELWEELYARIVADAACGDMDREEVTALEAAGVFFPAWHVL